MVEWLVPPVVVKVLGIEPYATPAVVAYRQVAFSLVARLRVVCVVPAASAPVGAPLDRTGGVVSVGCATVKLMVKSLGLALPAVSWHRTKKL